MLMKKTSERTGQKKNRNKRQKKTKRGNNTAMRLRKDGEQKARQRMEGSWRKIMTHSR